MLGRRFGLAVLLALTFLGCSEDQVPDNAVLSRSGYLLARDGGLVDVGFDGSQREVLRLRDGSIIYDPALSPDGRYIAFIRQEPVKSTKYGIDFGSDLYIVNRDGSAMRELVRHGALAEYVRTPSWLSDTELLFSVRGRTAEGAADFRVSRLDTRTGEVQRVVENAVDVAVGPDLNEMLYVQVETVHTREGLVLARVDGSLPRVLLPPDSTLTLFGSAAISPDGSRVAFAAGDAAEAAGGAGRGSHASTHPAFQDLWVINVDGSGLERLAELVETGLSIGWSVDGNSIIAFGSRQFRRVDLESGTTSLGPGGEGGIFVYDLDRR
jgi:Tol biopolymer transport system component